MTALTHEAILESRIDRITDRCEHHAARATHHQAVASSLEASIRNLTAYKHMTRDQVADYLLAAIDRSHELADQLCPLPVDADVPQIGRAA